MPVNVLFPKVSLEAASGRIARWCVGDGDAVTAGQVLFEIDNDKAAVEVESPGSGIIRNLTGAETEVDVGAEVARIYASGEAVASAPARTVESATAAVTVISVPTVPAHTSRKGPNPTPLARRIARERGVSLEGLSGSGPGGRIQRKDVLAHLAAPAVQDATKKRPLHAVWLRRGAGVPVVMLHGFSADHNNWRGLFAGGRSDWPALAIDLPGHGQSPRTIPDHLDEIAELVEATLAAEQVGPAVLAGHSFGGALAVRLAHRARLDIRGLCLFAPGGLGPEINGPFTEGILRAKAPESLRPWLELLVHDPAAISDSFLRAVMQQRSDDGLMDAMRAFAGRFFPDGTQSISVRAELGRLQHLVRVVFGRQDRILPFAATAGLPGNVALHAIDACGHMPHIEHPELALRILSEVWRAA
jgi:pimeloyl-ACP methyl ester carboxylesterase